MGEASTAAPAASGATKSTGENSSDNPPEASRRNGLLARFLARFLTKPYPPEHAEAASAHSAGFGLLERLQIEDIAVPRGDIIAVPEEIDRAVLLNTFRESGYSRLPVYRDTLDTPLGLLHLKDLALSPEFASDVTPASLRALLRPVLYVPTSMPVPVLMQKMQQERTHMALIIDEYGGVDGLVTIEDVIEQIVGEIEDEHDTEEEGLWVEEKPGIFLCAPRLSLEEFNALVGPLAPEIDEEEDSPETLGGLVYALLGRIPARGELVRCSTDLEFEVVDADPRRIKRIRVITHAPDTQEAAADVPHKAQAG